MAGRTTEGKWERFTGRHLATAAVALVVGVFLAPGTVQALSHSDPVSARASAPTKPFSVSKQVDSSLYVVGPVLATVDITNLTLAVADASTGVAGFELSEFLVPQTDKHCLSHQTFVRVIWSIPHFDAATPATMSFPTPLQIRPPSGKKVCLYGTLRTNAIPLKVNVSGYLS